MATMSKLKPVATQETRERWARYKAAGEDVAPLEKLYENDPKRIALYDGLRVHVAGVWAVYKASGGSMEGLINQTHAQLIKGYPKGVTTRQVNIALFGRRFRSDSERMGFLVDLLYKRAVGYTDHNRTRVKP